VSPQDLPPAGNAAAMLVIRDNGQHRNDIERAYRLAIRTARERIVIANAYFFPSYRFIRDLRHAAKRGVDVRLILQGQPDMPWVRTAATLLYDRLLSAGVRIYEYCERPFHGKVALVDDEWSTAGSSNLDPLSLGLNLEANVLVRDTSFNAELYRRLERMMTHACRVIEPQATPLRGWRFVRSYVAYQFARHYPSWTSWLPRQVPRLTPAAASPLQPAYAAPGTEE
jgi:cardiolipin synthase A/B